MCDCDCAQEFDSFLTIGMDGPATQPGALSSVGLDFDAWDLNAGISSNNGAVFFMDPRHGSTSMPVVFAQLTVPNTAGIPSGSINAQGKAANGAPDWAITGMLFGGGGSGAAPAPPPPAPNPFGPPPPPPSPSPFGPPPPAPSAQGACASGTVCPVVNQISTAKAGYTTYQVAVAFDRSTTADVYALFGEQGGHELIIPAAFHAPIPFGTNIGASIHTILTAESLVFSDISDRLVVLPAGQPCVLCSQRGL